MKQVLIIGGGISGLSSAYYLLQAGYQVRVIDKGDLTQGASNINAGYTAPSHIISLAAPGVINKGLKWMWNSSSPLYIKPRADLDFLDWAWKFKKSATREKVERAIPILKELNMRSRDLYEELLAGVDFQSHYQRKGLLTVYTTKAGEREEIEKAKRIREENLEVEILSKQELLKLQPALGDQVRGASYYICDSHSTPHLVMSKLANYLAERGVQFSLNEQVESLESTNGKLERVITNKDQYTADEVVLAAGSWTPELAKKLGLRIPLQGGKGYSIDVHRETQITVPTILAEAKVAITPMQGFTRFAGTMEFSGQNDYIRKERVRAIANAAEGHYPSLRLEQGELDKVRSGLRPVSPDGLPFIGRTRSYSNLTIAAGHAMIGWSLGAITGKLVSQIVSHQKPLMDIQALLPERFGATIRPEAKGMLQDLARQA